MESENIQKKAITKKRKGLNIVLNVFGVVILCVITLFVIRNTWYREIYIIGNSMNPTLNDNEHAYMNISKTAKKNLSRFDIIVADATDLLNETTTIIKRVIAFAGETISIDSKTGEIKIDQVLIKQDFITNDIQKRTCSIYSGFACDKEYLIPENSVFVLGDNRGNSLDSETKYGAIPLEAILGKLLVVFKKCNDQQTACSLITPRFY